MIIKRPTEAELEILNVLWKVGPSTVREVHEASSSSREVFYTTTLKTMQVMTEKGFLSRDTTHRSHVYRAILDKEAVEKNMVKKLLESMFSGSTTKLIISALGHKKPNAEELEEIKSLIEKLKNDK